MHGKLRLGGVMALILAGAASSVLAQQTTVVFSAGFETTDTPSYVNGAQIHTAGGAPFRWKWSGNDIGRVTNDPTAVYSGAQGLECLRSTTPNSQYLWTSGTNAFAAITNGDVRIEFAAKSTGWTNTGLLDFWVQTDATEPSGSDSDKSSRAAWVTLRGSGQFQAYTNNSGAFNVVTNLTSDTWYLVRLDMSVTGKTYNAFLNGNQVTTNYSFYGSSAAGRINSIQFKEYNGGLNTGGVFLDDVKVSHIVDGNELEITAFGPAGGVAGIQLNGTSPGEVYSIEATTSLPDQPQVWVGTGVTAPGNGGSIALTVTNDAAYQIYRAVMVPEVP